MSWKREEIPDHKFDFVDVEEFTDESWTRKLAYSSVFIIALKDYISGAKGSNITLFAGPSSATSTPVERNAVINSLGGPLTIFILIIASLFASFILLAFEWRKAQKIIKSRDISYAFTSEVAYSYYTIRSYPHYCFFSQIQNSRKPVDVLAFWVYFKFKGWKRLILAEFPRQFLNALVVYDLFNTSLASHNHNLFESIQGMFYDSSNPKANSPEKIIYLSLQCITITIWLISALGLLIAFFIYIPLLCNIRGNLKEYCVHKVDKRIAEILKRKTRKRLQDVRKQEQERIENGGGSSSTLNQPTLPQIDVDLDDNQSYSSRRPYPQYATYAYPPQQAMGGDYSDYGSDAGSSVSGYRVVYPPQQQPAVPGKYYPHGTPGAAGYAPNQSYSSYSNMSYPTPQSATSYGQQSDVPYQRHHGARPPIVRGPASQYALVPTGETPPPRRRGSGSSNGTSIPDMNRAQRY
ncbi:hypothetical protein HDU91_000050 [Kappamyces sp. JEL0680]|nr:hypothetical protein HDU91_000050 [Kappamyces sp. JEL0680]